MDSVSALHMIRNKQMELQNCCKPVRLVPSNLAPICQPICSMALSIGRALNRLDGAIKSNTGGFMKVGWLEGQRSGKQRLCNILAYAQASN